MLYFPTSIYHITSSYWFWKFIKHHVVLYCISYNLSVSMLSFIFPILLKKATALKTLKCSFLFLLKLPTATNPPTGPFIINCESFMLFFIQWWVRNLRKGPQPFLDVNEVYWIRRCPNLQCFQLIRRPAGKAAKQKGQPKETMFLWIDDVIWCKMDTDLYW